MAPTCKACRLPAAQRAQLADMHRRGVPLRAIAEEMTAAGHPLHRDAIHRHCRAHVAPADLHDIDHSPSEAAAGLTVAAVVASELRRWPTLAVQTAVALRAEGLDAAAEVVAATTPEETRAAPLAAAGTPASELMQARLLVRAMRTVFGEAHPEVSRALATELQLLGGEDLADALDDLAAAVEISATPQERAEQIQLLALAAAHQVQDLHDRGRALQTYARMYDDPQPWLDHLAKIEETG